MGKGGRWGRGKVGTGEGGDGGKVGKGERWGRERGGNGKPGEKFGSRRRVF